MELANIFKTNRSTTNFLIFGLLMICVSGLVFGISYYVMDIAQDAFEGANCTLTNNAFFASCQDVWAMFIYPVLGLKTVLVYMSIFFMFILIMGMLLSGYNSGSKPYMLGFLLLVYIGITYASLWVSNIYNQFLSNEIIRNAMSNFVIYNNFMLNLPWFVAVISLFSFSLGIVNWQRVTRNTPQGELDY